MGSAYWTDAARGHNQFIIFSEYRPKYITQS